MSFEFAAVPLPDVFYAYLVSTQSPSFGQAGGNNSSGSDSENGVFTGDGFTFSSLRHIGSRFLMQARHNTVAERVLHFVAVSRHAHNRVYRKLLARAALFELGKVLLRHRFPKDLRIVLSYITWDLMV